MLYSKKITKIKGNLGVDLENKLSENPSQEVLKITCICGHEVRSNYMKRHLGSKIHEAGVKIQQKKNTFEAK